MKIRKLMATLTMLETPGRLSHPLDLLRVLSKTLLQPAHPVPIYMSTCAKTPILMVSLVLLGWEPSVDLAA